MAVYKEINRADGSGVTTFYRISNVLDTAETDDQEGQAVIIDYNQAQNKPSINGVTLIGNKTTEDLGLQPAGDYITNDEADEKFIDEDELEAKNYVNQAELQDAIAHIEHFHREIVEALPVTGMDNVLYMVRKGGTGEDIYNEYIWVGLSSSEDGYEFLGTTATDLTDYYKKSQVDAALATKVDKEGGKGLSEQNYTLAEKTKLAGLENYDDTEIQAEVSGLNTDVNNLKSSNVTISNALAELKPDVESNTAAVSTIYDLLDNKMTAIRLVEQGDGWVWMNLEGSRLTYAQASAALGHENCMLFIEQLENDGKVIPAEYKSEGDHINVIFKDLDSLVHIMTCGEDDVVVTESASTTNGYTNFTVENEAVGYGAMLDTVYGNTKQNNYTGKNLFNIEEWYNDSSSHDWSSGANTFSINSNRQLVSAVPTHTDWYCKMLHMSDQPTQVQINQVKKLSVPVEPSTRYSLSFETNLGAGEFEFLIFQYDENGIFLRITSGATVPYSFTTGEDTAYAFIRFDNESYRTTAKSMIVSKIQLEKNASATSYEPYTGTIPSPNGAYPSNIETVSGQVVFTSVNKNLLSNLLLPRTDEYGMTTVLNDDGTLTTTGKPISAYKPIIQNLVLDDKLVDGATYVMSQTQANGKLYLQVNVKNRETGVTQYIYLQSNASQTFTVDLKKNTYSVVAQCGTLSSWGDSELTITQYYQLEKGTTPSAFHPYQGQRIILNLGNIELCKIGNYQDKIYKQDGVWYLHKEIGKVIDSGGAWIVSGAPVPAGQKAYRADITYNFIRNTSGYVNRFNLITSNWSTSNPDWTAYYEYNNNQGYLYVKVPESLAPDLETWKAWLNTNNLVMYGVLEEFTNVEITDSTLIAQLENLQYITQYKDTDITIVGANLTPEADFTYIDNVVINNTDLVLGKDTYWNDEVPTQQDLPSNAQEGEIRIVQDTENVYIYNGTKWVPFDKSGEVDLSNYLAKDNTTAWIPTGPFNPSTKKYVDDSISGIHVPTKTSQLTNDSNFINKNANDLTNYYPKSNTYTRAEVDALIHSGGTGVQVVVVGDTLVITTVLPGGE